MVGSTISIRRGNGRKSVTRADLGEAVYERAAGSRKSARALVDMVLEEIGRALSHDELVKLSSFGSFVVRSKPERVGRNPRTGVEARIVARRVIVFHASARLREQLNRNAVLQTTANCDDRSESHTGESSKDERR